MTQYEQVLNDVRRAVGERYYRSDNSPLVAVGTIVAAAILKGASDIAGAIQRLGTGDAYTGGVGAIEALAMTIGTSGDGRTLAAAMGELSDAINRGFSAVASEMEMERKHKAPDT